VRGHVFLLVLAVWSLGLAASSDGTLRIHVIDTEGGKAILVVGPNGQAMLVDAGFPGFSGRDADRIEKTVKACGLDHLDWLVVTHYDVDHVGNVPEVASRIRVDTFIDHGQPSVDDQRTRGFFEAYLQSAQKARRLIVKPGDRIPMAGVEIIVVSAAGALIDRPIDGNGVPNPYCQAVSPKQWSGTDEDASENAQSIGLLYRFGRFRMLDLADLTWNKELALVCPVNRIGQVDVFIVSHHGHDISNSPALVHAIRPRVAIMENGPRKFGRPDTMKVVRSSPGLEAFYQTHWSFLAGQLNSEDDLIANLQEGPDGNGLVLVAQPDGTFTVTNARTGQVRRFSRQ